MEESFEAFVRTARDPLHRFAVVLLGDRRADAEDCVQDALIRVASHWESIDDPTAYARRAVLNSVRDGARTWTRRREQLTRLKTSNVEDHADQVVLQRSTISQLLLLTRKQREVLAARFLLDLTEKQSAELLGCSVGTIKSQTFKALAQLRSMAEA